MGKYEDLLIKHSKKLINDTFELPGNFKGFYDNGVILIDSKLDPFVKHETLAEEIAHDILTYGNILNDSKMLNKKFELKARRLASENIISLNGIIDAFYYGVSNLYEMSQYFEVTESFIIKTLEHYKQKYGLSTYNNGYLIIFEPLQVFKYKNMEE